MRSLKRIVVASSCLVAIVLAIGFLTGGVVKADPKASDVRVVNTPAEPVPVALGSGTVPVTLGGATVPVSYTNTKSTPVFVDEGNIARAGVAGECGIAFYDGETSCTLGSVPAGKILVIESVSCHASVPAGSGGAALFLNMGSPQISGGAGYLNLNFPIALAHTRSISGGPDGYEQVVPVRLYAVGDVRVFASAPSGSHDAGCAISGHLVAQ